MRVSYQNFVHISCFPECATRTSYSIPLVKDTRIYEEYEPFTPAGSKNDVFKLRSVSNIVIAPANTGRDKRRRSAVIDTDQTASFPC